MKSTTSIPLEGHVLSQLVLSETLAAPGTKLTIGDRWQISNGSNWLLLHHTPESTLEVCLRWVSKRYEGIYVVLESAWSALDRDNPPQYFLAEVVSKNAVRLLQLSEIENTLPHIQAEIIGRQIWPETKRKSVLTDDIKQVFGEFSLP